MQCTYIIVYLYIWGVCVCAYIHVLQIEYTWNHQPSFFCWPAWAAECKVDPASETDQQTSSVGEDAVVIYKYSRCCRLLSPGCLMYSITDLHVKKKKKTSPFFLGSLSGLWMIAVENHVFWWQPLPCVMTYPPSWKGMPPAVPASHPARHPRTGPHSPWLHRCRSSPGTFGQVGILGASQ